jgi:hypothetical protein
MMKDNHKRQKDRWKVRAKEKAKMVYCQKLSISLSQVLIKGFIEAYVCIILHVHSREQATDYWS